MSTSPARSRLAASVAVLAASAAVVAGCGGASEEDYAKAYNDACTKLTQAGKELGPKLTRLGQSSAADPDKIVAEGKKVIVPMLNTFSEQLNVMADQKAPKKWEQFQSQISTAVGKADKPLNDLKSKIEGATTLNDLMAIQDPKNFKSITDALSSVSKFPADLAKQAPACGTMQ